MGFLSKILSNTKCDIDGVAFIGNFSHSQRDFLIDTEEAYTLAYKQKKISYLAKCTSRELYVTVYNNLSYSRPWVGISDTFKNIAWTMVQVCTNGDYIVDKKIVFDKVKVTRQLKISVADDYTERWYIRLNNLGSYELFRIDETYKGR